MTPLLLSQLHGLAMRLPKGFRAWCKTQVKIKDKVTGKVSPWTLNTLQEQVCDIVEYCLENEIPIRIICVKPRQKGSSTIFTALVTWLLHRAEKVTAIILGAQYENVKSLWEYLTLFSETDKFDWGHAMKVGGEKIAFGNGSQIREETAKDKNAAVSWDCRVMHLTECALWSEDGVANAREMLANALGSVEYLPETCVIMESTGRGPAGVFWETWTNSVWLEDYKKDPHKHRGKYIRVFAPWYAFGRLSRDPLTEPQKAALAADLTAKERRIMDKYSLDLEQMAWRRRTLEEKYKGDEQKFAQEHPASPEEAFAASTPSIFSPEGLEVLASHVDLDHGKWQHGLLKHDRESGGVSFLATDERSALWELYEKPQPGERYLIGADFASGKAEDKKGENRDHHAVIVLRKGRFDPVTGWRKPRVVMRTVWPCQWDIDLLEEEIWAAHLYFGRCLIVPERNKDDGVTRNLVGRGANVFAPTLEQDISLGMRESKPSAYYGFTTTGGREGESSKRMLVRLLIEAIREHDQPGSGLIVDARTLHELQVFVQSKEGRYGAIPGEHDDSVMALAFCLACQEQATLYFPSALENPMAYGDPLFLRPGSLPGSIPRRGGAGL